MAIPEITEEQIQELCTPQSFGRGMRYYRQGAIINPVKQGNTLKAYCEGSSYEPYRVKVEFDDEGIASATCTCPYDWGGYCKHIVALLLTWLYEPESFRDAEELDEILNRMNKEELIELIKRMLKREPQLERLIELGSAQRRTPIDPEVYRRQVDYALREAYEWGRDYAPEFEEILENAEGFVKEEDYHNAFLIYSTVAEELVNRLDEVYDDVTVTDVLYKCIEGMGECLPHFDTETRQKGLLTLVDFSLALAEYGWEEDFTHIIAQNARPEDWPVLEKKLFKKLDKIRDGWVWDAAARLLLKAYEAQGKLEEFLTLCEEACFYLEEALKLLEMGRKEEALDAMEADHVPEDIIQFAEALVAQGDADAALEFVAGRLRQGEELNLELATWLAEQYARQGRTSEAQKLWLRIFQERPRLEHYRRLRELAEELGRWDTLRPRILSGLEHDGEFAVLVDIYLDEGEHDKALRMLEALKAKGNRRWLYAYPADYVLKVARAVEGTHPREAIALYRELAEKTVDRVNRKAYREAVEYLKRIRELYCSLGETHEWEEYIAALRAQYPRRRALQEELDLAGL